MADSVQLAFEALDKVTGPMRQMTQQANRLKETLARINSADKMALGVMRSKTQLMQEQIRAANRLQIAQLRASKSPDRGGFGGLLDKLGSGGLQGLLGAAVGGGIATLIAGAIGLVARLGIALAQMGLQATVAFTKAAVGAAVFAQNTTMALDMITKGHGAEEFDKIRRLAADLGLEVQGTVKQYKDLRAMQFSAAQAEGIVKMAADMQALGADAQKVESVMRAMTQVKGKGKLMMEELTSQLAEAGVSTELVVANLAKTRSISADAVRQLIAAGKIGADEGVAAIQSAVMEKLNIKSLGEAGKKMADSTISGMRNRLVGKLENLWLDLGKKLEPVLMRLAPIAQDIMDALDSPDAQKVIDAIALTFDNLTSTLLEVWPVIKAFGKGFGTGFTKGLESMTRAMGPAFEQFAQNPDNIKNMTELANAAGKAFGLMAAALAATAIAITNVGTAWDKAFGTFDMKTLVPKDGGKGSGLFGMLEGGLPKIPSGSSMLGNSMTGTAPAPAVTNVTNNNTPSISISVSGLTYEGLQNKIRDIVIAQLKQQFGGG